MAFEELITWSDQKVRPDWQKDALRRLATTGELSKEDLSDLRRVGIKTRSAQNQKEGQRHPRQNRCGRCCCQGRSGKPASCREAGGTVAREGHTRPRCERAATAPV